MDEPRRLGDRYELGAVIGRGGMAEVFEGSDLRLGRRVAVKLLRTDLARDPSFHARFRREAQSAASLNHPNIVAVYDTGDTDLDGVAVPYIVMEYVDGTTLRDLIKAGHHFTPDRAVEITEGTLTALDYSHRHGIIHRDIKPGNVMLTRAGQVKVMDFGIARAVADSAATMTQTSAVLGTAQYLSPEQARGEVVDSRSDLYSTGCLLYELLTGRPPFMGDSPVSVAYQHVRESPVPPSSVDPEVPELVDAVVMKSLQKRPSDRYETAAEMREDLERARLGQPLVGAAVVGAGVASSAAGAGGDTGDATQVIAPVLPGTSPATATVEPKRKNRAGWYVVLGLAAVGALALALVLGRSLFSGSDANIAVPDLSGLDHTQVAQQLTKRGLRLGVEQNVPNDNVPAGHVVSQSPAADTHVASNTAVDVTYSSGAAKVTVPTLVGLTQSQAIQALTTAGLTLGPIHQKDSVDQPAGTVIAASPPEGTSVAKGSAVTLTVSSGKVPVPSVVGQPEAQAKAELSNAGFESAVVHETSDSVTPGTVISQSPSAGTLLAQGKIVTITVAVAPPSPTPTPTPTPTSSGGSPSPNP